MLLDNGVDLHNFQPTAEDIMKVAECDVFIYVGGESDEWVEDYNLNYYAAFVGCSAETEASFETITFLANKLDELNLKTVLTIENSDNKIAKTVIENTNSKDTQILEMDSMQSTTSSDVANGVTYIGIMESNLEVLKEALG